MLVQVNHRKGRTRAANQVHRLLRHTLERNFLEGFLHELLVFRTRNGAHRLEHLERTHRNRERGIAVAEFRRTATDINRHNTFAMPFLDGTVSKLALFFARNDSRLDPQGMLHNGNHLVGVFGVPHCLSHDRRLEVCPQGMQVHTELRHDGFKFLYALFGDLTALVNVFAQAADFNFLQLRDKHLARGGPLFGGGSVFESRNQKNAAMAPDIDGGNQFVIHWMPRRYCWKPLRLWPSACRF